MMNRGFKTLATVVICAWLTSLTVPAAANTADHGNLGTLQTVSLDNDGITATGSNDVFMSSGTGIGIVGGILNLSVDTNESISFSFNIGAAVNVTYRVIGAGNGDLYTGLSTFEAFL